MEARLQKRTPPAMIVCWLKRSARYPDGILANASTISSTVCSDPSCESVTLKCCRNSGSSGFNTWRSAKLTKLIKASTARRRTCAALNGMKRAIMDKFSSSGACDLVMDGFALPRDFRDRKGLYTADERSESYHHHQ